MKEKRNKQRAGARTTKYRAIRIEYRLRLLCGAYAGYGYAHSSRRIEYSNSNQIPRRGTRCHCQSQCHTVTLSHCHTVTLVWALAGEWRVPSATLTQLFLFYFYLVLYIRRVYDYDSTTTPYTSLCKWLYALRYTNTTQLTHARTCIRTRAHEYNAGE